MNKKLKYLAAVPVAGLIAGLAACGTTHTVTKTVTVPGPVVTQTQKVPVPGETATVPVKVPVPGPTITKTVTVPAPPPSPGQQVAKFSGSGNESTPAFNVPDSGDYVVSWQFSGNGDGFGNGGNFIMSATNSAADVFSLPNDIASSGSGSTEVTGDSGTDSFNVQAEDGSSWTVTIVAAS